MVFVFDIDDTIAETDEYSEKYILKFFAENNLPYRQIKKTVRFAEQKFSWKEQTALKWYKKFGDEMMLQFPCKKGAVELINDLHDAGHKIVITTARAQDWHTNPQEITLQWLKKNGIKFDKLFFESDKANICEEVDADFFVDDDFKVAQKVGDLFFGHPHKEAFLMTTDFNKPYVEEESCLTRISNFDDLRKELKKHSIFLDKEKTLIQ